VSGRSRALFIGCLAIAVVILSGTAGLMYWGHQRAAKKVGGEIAFQFKDHPAVRRHIGADASFAVQCMERDDAKDQAEIRLHARGSAGEGLLWARIESAGGGEGFNVVAAELRREGEEAVSLLPPGE